MRFYSSNVQSIYVLQREICKLTEVSTDRKNLQGRRRRRNRVKKGRSPIGRCTTTTANEWRVQDRKARRAALLDLEEIQRRRDPSSTCEAVKLELIRKTGTRRRGKKITPSLEGPYRQHLLIPSRRLFCRHPLEKNFRLSWLGSIVVVSFYSWRASSILFRLFSYSLIETEERGTEGMHWWCHWKNKNIKKGKKSSNRKSEKETGRMSRFLLDWMQQPSSSDIIFWLLLLLLMMKRGERKS